MSASPYCTEVSAMSFKPIQNFPSHYWKSYQVMKDNFHGCPFLFDVGDDAFRNKVVEVLPKQESLKILGIGSGKGELDCINIRRMLTRFFRIDNTVVEPSLEAVQVYKSLISGDLSDRVNTNWYQETFQQYQQLRESSSATGKFHFISAIHSLYYTGKDGGTIKYLIDLLEEDGILFIEIQNDDSGFINFHRKVEESCRPSYNSVSEATATSLVKKLLDDDDRVTYEVLQNRHKINITSCFEADSSDGSLLLDFLTQVVDFKSAVSKDVLQSLLDYLKTPECSEVLNDGKIIFREDWDTIIIRKK